MKKHHHQNEICGDASVAINALRALKLEVP